VFGRAVVFAGYISRFNPEPLLFTSVLVFGLVCIHFELANAPSRRSSFISGIDNKRLAKLASRVGKAIVKRTEHGNSFSN